VQRTDVDADHLGNFRGDTEHVRVCCVCAAHGRGDALHGGLDGGWIAARFCGALHVVHDAKDVLHDALAGDTLLAR
jgi:hypothetical protein